MMKTILMTIAVAVCLFSCTKKTPDQSCKNVTCTTEYRYIEVDIKDLNGNKIILDDHYTVNVKNGDTIRAEQVGAGAAYSVLDDSYTKKMYNQSIDFHFYGIKNNIVVVSESYTISADCCHINKVAGKGSIIVY